MIMIQNEAKLKMDQFLQHFEVGGIWYPSKNMVLCELHKIWKKGHKWLLHKTIPQIYL